MEFVKTVSSHLKRIREKYNTILLEVLNCHASIKTRTSVSRPTAPWCSNGIDSAKRQRRKAERKWLKTKLTVDLNVYKAKKVIWLT